MKKWKIYSIVVTVILFLVIIGICLYSVVFKKTISEEEARNIAMQRVGKTNDQVTFTEIKKDKENGINVYDVEFYDNEKSYEISIDIETKEIISYKEDYMPSNTVNNTINNTANTDNTISNSNNNTNSNNNFIGAEKAKEIALEHAGISNSNDVRFIKTELDFDHNVSIYEIEFYFNQSEYEYKVNAVTGEIIKYEIGH